MYSHLRPGNCVRIIYEHHLHVHNIDNIDDKFIYFKVNNMIVQLDRKTGIANGFPDIHIATEEELKRFELIQRVIETTKKVAWDLTTEQLNEVLNFLLYPMNEGDTDAIQCNTHPRTKKLH